MELEIEEAAEEEKAGGEGATQVLLIVSHELAGPEVLARVFRLKRSRSRKHKTLRCCRGCSSPRGNVLVERRSFIKHSSHISHLRCVPIPNGLVERRSGTNIACIVVTCAVFQLPMSWLNAEAE